MSDNIYTTKDNRKIEYNGLKILKSIITDLVNLNNLKNADKIMLTGAMWAPSTAV